MKKKSLLSMLFVGLFGFATTSTVVSCKDYDDDIKNVNQRVDKLSAEAALHATKAELQTEVTNLKAQLDQAKADLQAAINKKADQTTVDALQAALDKAKADLQAAIDKKADQTTVDALQAALNKAKEDLQAAIDTKADKAWAVKQIEDLTGKIAGLETRIKANEDAIAAINQLVAELQTSKADKSWVEARLEELNNKKADKEELATEVGKLNKAIEDAEKKLLEAIDKKADKTTVEQLQKDLDAAKADYTKKIAELNTALDQAKKDLQAAIDTKADKTTVEKLQKDFDQAVKDLNAAIALKADQKALEAEIAARKAADDQILSYVDGKVLELDGKIAALETKLNDYLKKEVFESFKDQYVVEQAEQDIRIIKLESDLAIQEEALQEFKEEVKEALQTYMEMIVNQFGVVEGQIEEINEQLTNLGARIAWAEGYIENLFLDVEYLADTKLDAEAFDEWVNEVYKVKVAEIEASINKVASDLAILQNYVSRALTSLVFVPDCYYWGIEAANIELVATYSFKVNATDAKTAEAKGYTDDTRYDSTLFKTTYGYAKYHKNPANVDIDPAKLSIVSFDRKYTRAVDNYSVNAAPAGLSIDAEREVVQENGDLYVPLTIEDVSKVCKVNDTDASGVTVFALEYNISTAGKDTTITSDYAALLASEDTVHYKVALEKNPMAVSSISTCNAPTTIATNDLHGHAMQTVNEAGVKNASYELPFGETIDVAELISSHKVLYNGEGTIVGEETIDADAFKAKGFKFEYALTKYEAENGKAGAKVNQSEHATLTGSKITTINCDYDAILYGYTPVVRVVLKDEKGRVLDYGYIKFQITGDLCKYIGKVEYNVPDAAKVKSYWYAINGAEYSQDFKEIHYNVKTPEEAGFQQTWIGAQQWNNTRMANALALANNKFINVFASENVFKLDEVKISDADNHDMKDYVQATDFIFTLSTKNNGKVFKGDTGASYKMHITANGDSLIANKVGAEVEGADTVVATLYKDVPMAEQKLVLNHESDYAKDLLNYVGRYELDNDFLTVEVALGLTVVKNVVGGQDSQDTWTEECKTVETENVWPARFIRPINLDYKNPTPIQDAKRGSEAGQYQGQPAYLNDILSFTDWQNVPVQPVALTGTNCLYRYYGITSVEILGADGNALANGDDVIAKGDNVTTNIANPTTDDAQLMSNVIVGGAVTLTYRAATDTQPAHIWYINNGNTVAEIWWFEIPVRVNYYWGSFTRRVKVYVDPTYNQD